MNDKNAVGVTEIGHDSESSIKVLKFNMVLVRLMFSDLSPSLGLEANSAFRV